jgi:lysophospholipase L1-like esterase
MNGAADSDEMTDQSITEDEKVSENTVPEKEVKVEDVSIDIAEKEEEEVVNGENDKRITVSEGIKEKVKGVVEGVIKLFKKDLKVVAIGDSLTQGVGDETENGGYVGILNNTFQDNNINVTIENYGKRGNRADQLVKRLEKKEIVASIQKADIVFITIGANDIMKIVRNNFMNLNIELFNQEKPEYLERLRVILNKIKELNPDTKIYLIGFYNPFDRYFADVEELQTIVEDWNESSKLVTEEFENVKYIPTSDLFSDSDIELLADDYFHPNTSGYKLMAKRILENMEEVSVEQEVMNEDVE